jgi:di-heme oxidoreductase (putative peroxidase)
MFLRCQLVLTLLVACSTDVERLISYQSDSEVLHARIIATGIPGAGALCQVGTYLTGGPFHDNPTFVAFTQPGRVLSHERILVASTSNFGAPLGTASLFAGSVLSIDPDGDTVAVPPDFASAGGQVSALGGRVQVYSANNAAFLNSVFHPAVATAAQPGAALPTGISINSGNGRPWFANAPSGSGGEGTITVIDPGGMPLAGAPSPVAGGVFAGDETNRDAASTHGLTSGALGTAILTRSPDLTGRAVFAAVEADGSVVQVHVQFGVDGLAPPGTVTPVAGVSPAAAESTDPAVTAREGIVFNWAPTQNLLIADPQANRIVVLDVADDGRLFTAGRRELRAHQLDRPIDLAPTTREVASGNFASNTTLGAGSELYVLNRGDNSIVRMTLAGRVTARRVVDAGITGARVNGIAVSEDGQTIYVSATTPGSGGIVMAVPAFGAPDATRSLMAAAFAAGAHRSPEIGAVLFSLPATVEQGLGPLFNGRACGGCHDTPFAGGMGVFAGQQIDAIGRSHGDGFTSLEVARAHSIAELGEDCDLPTGVPADANVVSRRNPMTLRGDGLIETIQPGTILANAAAEPAAVRGHANVLPDGRIGKFGWKANVATLVEFMGLAYRNELGITNPVQPVDLVRGCGGNQDRPEIDGLPLTAQVAFLDTLDPPAVVDQGAACRALPGFATFQAAGCGGCHTPTLRGRGIAAPLYSDLLVHDMGPGLADGISAGSASGSEWRTMPLWRLAERTKFLHDARAATLDDAIAAHGGQAAAAATAFSALPASDRSALLEFLGCI